MKRFHIVITGGHHNSALVVAQELVKLGHKVTWIGHRQAASGDTHDSAEYVEVTAANLPFYNLRAGKLNLHSGLAGLIKFPLGLIQSSQLLSNLNPDAVLSFGGYLGLTVALTARARSIPVFLHEQTVIAGKANKLTANFARRIYLTWESSRKFFSAQDVQVVGLPLRASILNPQKTKLFKNSLPTILVLGGKQGSHIINKLVLRNLESLLAKYNIIHQLGTSSVTGDYQMALSKKDSLPEEIAARYQPEGYIGESEIGSLLASCDLYMGRSGAHITYELGMLRVRSVLIPFRHTHGNEQVKNAKYLAQSGLATILPQSKLTLSSVVEAITKSLSDPSPDPLPLPHDATTLLVEDLLNALTL
jgi:UDP-N-acetylglucosamine--N-acetylmuramyl-(pentapeptide) pyrophosphoryl-undecaprenol N-acetylglucosamine transferase